MTPKRLIIDTDPGIDDAMAIAVACAARELEVVALTTVFGNHHIDVTTANAQRIIDHLGCSGIPVVRGAESPLIRPIGPPATFVHGDDGLGDAGLLDPSSSPAQRLSAAQYLVESVLAHPGSLTIVAIGPLTNLALALRIEPHLHEAIDELVVMGGAAFVAGNVTPSAEANIWNDPEAAEIVFSSGVKTTMIGLDVTNQILATEAWIDELSGVDTPAAELVCRTAPTYVRFHREVDGTRGMFCHDVATIAYLLRPELFTVVPMAVRVVTDGFAAGTTIVDPIGVADPEWVHRPRVEVAVSVDADGVLDLVRERLTAPPR